MSDKLTPSVRQWIYQIAAIAAGLIPLLTVYHVLEPTQGSAWTNFVAVLGALGSGGAATAAAVLSKQRKSGTLDFTGSADQQAIAAIQATVDQAGSATAALDRVKEAVESVTGGRTSIGCGDNLR